VKNNPKEERKPKFFVPNTPNWEKINKEGQYGNPSQKEKPL